MTYITALVMAVKLVRKEAEQRPSQEMELLAFKLNRLLDKFIQEKASQ